MRHSKTSGRALAFQTLFELEVRSGSDVIEVLDARVAIENEDEEESVSPEARNFAGRLVKGVIDERASLDARIAQVAPAFPVAQMATTDRAVIELALEEMLQDASTPVGVVINEAVELAKLYGGENSSRFVNGVLGTIAEELRAERGHASLQDDAVIDPQTLHDA